jgi:hypothetical protein
VTLLERDTWARRIARGIAFESENVLVCESLFHNGAKFVPYESAIRYA